MVTKKLDRIYFAPYDFDLSRAVESTKETQLTYHHKWGIKNYLDEYSSNISLDVKKAQLASLLAKRKEMEAFIENEVTLLESPGKDIFKTWLITSMNTFQEWLENN